MNVSRFHENSSQEYFQYDETFYPLVRHPLYIVILLSFAYGLAFVCAIVGNCFVIAVVIKFPWMRTVTNYFVVNLAVADILVAVFCVPFTLLDNVFSGWRLGAVMCKATPFIQQVCVCSSISTLAAIAVDRYMAICNTWLSRISKSLARSIIIVIWIMSVILSLPVAIFYEEYDHHSTSQIIPMCHQIWPDFDLQRAYFVVCLFLLCYAIPLVLILICYSSITIRVWRRHAPGVSNTCYSGIIHKSKIKVIKMFAIVISLFAISWLPLYVIYFKLYFFPPAVGSTEFNVLFNVVIPVSQWLGHCNSGINPIIYCFSNKKYRHGFKSLLTCKPYFYPSRFFHYQKGSARAESSSSTNEDRKQDRIYTQAKFMLVQFSNGNMTVSFRKEDTEQTTTS